VQLEQVVVLVVEINRAARKKRSREIEKVSSPLS
jgi:hypothetical protein